MKDSETRKLQQVGGTTLTVSLPKEWVEARELAAGDEIAFRENSDGTLTLQRSTPPDDGPITCIIDADACDGSLLAQCIVGGYILGYDILEIRSDGGLDRAQQNTIHRTMRRLNGMSIVHEGENTVRLRNFMDVTDSSIYVIMRRLSSTVLHMLDSSLYALIQQRDDLIDEVEAMEDDVDVLYWLILRQLLTAVEDKTIREDIGLESPLHIVGNRTAIKSLEEMADSIEAINSEVATLIEDGNVSLTQDQKEQLSDIEAAVHQQIEDAVESLIEEDTRQAHSVLERSELDTLTSTFLDSIDTADTDRLLAYHRIIWNIERVAGYSGFMAEIAINRAMEQDRADDHPAQLE